MKNFYTLQEYYNLYKDQLSEPFDDTLGRAIISRLLVSIYNIKPENIIESQGECWYDLAFSDETHKYALEVKQRHFDSTAFPTHLINEEKFRSAENAINNKQFGYAYLASIWQDGVIWINDMYDEDRNLECHWQNKTTQTGRSTDGVKERKRCIAYEPKDIYYVAMQYIQPTSTKYGGWLPIISRDPINIEILEDLWNKGIK